MSLPPVYDYSDDPDGFAAHLAAEMAKPCQHCDLVAPTVERPARFALFGPQSRATEVFCTACGLRRASFHPTLRAEGGPDGAPDRHP